MRGALPVPSPCASAERAGVVSDAHAPNHAFTGRWTAQEAVPPKSPDHNKNLYLRAKCLTHSDVMAYCGQEATDGSGT